MDGMLVSGLAWTAGAKWVSQLLAWASTLLVARILSPSDYGLLGMASIYLGLVSLLSEFGLGLSIVVIREMTRDQIAQLNSLAILLGLAGFLLSCAAAIPLGKFFDAPELPLVVVVMSSTFVISSFKVVPNALLQKTLRFRLLAWFEAVQAVVLAISMVIFAVLGFRYWTLVAGGVLGSVLITVLTVASQPVGFRPPRFHAIRKAVVISYHIIVSRLTWFVQTNADFAVIGRLLGQSLLGAYSIAMTMAMVPVEKITAMTARVAPSFFSAAQDDPASIRRYLLGLTMGISVVSFPAALGLALVGDDFVPLVLGEKWADAIAPMRILAVCAMLRSISPLLWHVLAATGGTRFSMHIGIVSAITLTAGFVIGSRWGIGGVAAAWLLLDPLLVLPVYWKVLRTIELPVGAYLRSLWPALSGCLVMASLVFATKHGVLSGWSAQFRLPALVALGVAAYGGTFLSFHRQQLAGLIRLAKLTRPATQAKPDADSTVAPVHG